MSFLGSFVVSVRDAVVRCAAVAAAAAVLLAAPAQARAEEHKDEKLGYSVVLPKKWVKRPIATNQRWVVAKFESEREFEDQDKNTGFWSRHRPWMDVVVIPLNLKKNTGTASVDEKTGAVVVDEAVPWTNLKEYLEETMQRTEGGFYFSKEEEAQVGGMKCLQYELTFDKLVDNPRRVWAWAYYTSDAIYGLVGESLIRFEEKLKPDLLAAFRSFRSFPRKGQLPTGETTGDDVVFRDSTLDDSTPEEQRNRRDEDFRRHLKKVKDSAGDGWIVRDSANFTAVSHADAKFTKEVLDHAEALRGWLDRNLGYLGTGYCGKLVLRVCADQDEYSALAQTGGWMSGRLEVLTYKDKEGWDENRMSSVNAGIWQAWMRDRNAELSWRMPMWISAGLSSLVGSARSKGGKVEFKAGLWDKERISVLEREGKLRKAADFFQMSSEELWRDFENHTQSEFFLRFLVAGAAQKNPRWKGVFADYMKAMIVAVDEDAAKRRKARREALKSDGDPAQGSGEPQSEEEEERMAKQRDLAWKDQERDFLLDLFRRVFGGWEQKDWDALTSSFWKELK